MPNPWWAAGEPGQGLMVEPSAFWADSHNLRHLPRRRTIGIAHQMGVERAAVVNLADPFRRKRRSEKVLAVVAVVTAELPETPMR